MDSPLPSASQLHDCDLAQVGFLHLLPALYVLPARNAKRNQFGVMIAEGTASNGAEAPGQFGLSSSTLEIWMHPSCSSRAGLSICTQQSSGGCRLEGLKGSSILFSRLALPHLACHARAGSTVPHGAIKAIWAPERCRPLAAPAGRWCALAPG